MADPKAPDDSGKASQTPLTWADVNRWRYRPVILTPRQLTWADVLTSPHASAIPHVKVLKRCEEKGTERELACLGITSEQLAENVERAWQGDEQASAWVDRLLRHKSGEALLRAELDRTRPARAYKAACRTILLAEEVLPSDKAN